MPNTEESLPAETEFVVRFRVHRIAWIPMMLWIILGFASLGFTWWLALYEYLRLKFLEQGVTSNSVVLKKGIMNRTTEELGFQSIATVDVVQGMLGRRFGFGTVRVKGRGIGLLAFRDIEDPVSVKRRLEDLRDSAS